MSRPSTSAAKRAWREVVVVEVDADHARGAAPLHLDGVEAGVAADVEHGLAGEVLRDGVLEAAPLDVRVVAQEMLGRGLDAAQVDVVEPGPSAAARLRISSASAARLDAADAEFMAASLAGMAAPLSAQLSRPRRAELAVRAESPGARLASRLDRRAVAVAACRRRRSASPAWTPTARAALRELGVHQRADVLVAPRRARCQSACSSCKHAGPAS